MKRNIILIGLCFQILVIGINAQENIQKEFFSIITDSAHVANLCDSAWHFFNQNQPDSVVKYASSALRLAESNACPELLSRASLLLAYGKHDNFNYEEAIHLYQAHIDQQSELGLPYDSCMINLNLAKCHTHLDHIDLAIQYFDKAYEYLDLVNFDQCFKYNFSLAFFFYHQGVYDRSNAFRKKMLNSAIEAQDSHKILVAQNSLGFGYNAAGLYDSAIVVLQEAVPLSEALENKYLEWMVKACLGICYIEIEKYDTGVYWLEEAMPIGLEFGEDLCCGNGAFLAKAYINLNNKELALSFLEKAKAQLPGIEDLLDKKNVLEAIYSVYEKMNQPDSALIVYKDLQNVRDSITLKTYLAQVAEMDVRLKTKDLLARINQQNKRIDQQSHSLLSYQNALFVLLLILVFTFFVWGYSWNVARQKHAKYRLLLEQRLNNQVPETQEELSEGEILLQNIENCIAAHYDDPQFSVPDLAKKLGRSQRSLNRVIKDMSGVSPVQLIKTFRMEMAKVRLWETNHNISEIAYEIGFTDPSYFSKVFKDYTGHSPSEWKNAKGNM